MPGRWGLGCELLDARPAGGAQGMNVLSGIFLYVMPEVDAFFAFNSLVTRHCPGYITANLDGVFAGCELVERVLMLVGRGGAEVGYRTVPRSQGHRTWPGTD
jgi:hypothetical protein